MRSEARARLARMIEEQGMDGVLRVDTYGGTELPPGSERFSPCRCPQHRCTEPEGEASKLSVAVREVNEHSGGERL